MHAEEPYTTKEEKVIHWTLECMGNTLVITKQGEQDYSRCAYPHKTKCEANEHAQTLRPIEYKKAV